MAKNWSRDEHILAFNLYCKIPFSKINANYPPIRELASIIGRTNASVAMKLANFARLDPILKAKNISGLTQGAKGEEHVWNEFNNKWEELAICGEKLLSKFRSQLTSNEEMIDIPVGLDKEIISKSRINQEFFRSAVLASYNNSCCITGSKEINLLSACHIIPWSKSLLYRTDPRNGLCMNIFHHKAFDMGLFTITPDFSIIVTNSVLESQDKLLKNFISVYHNKKMILPQKFLPNDKCLIFHNSNIFLR